jgi:hypothetical protein
MATADTSPTQPSAPRGRPTAHKTPRERVERAVRRRAGRLRGLLFVVALLLPLLTTTLLGAPR